MLLCEHFAASLLVSTNLVHFRSLLPGEEITLATRADVPAMLEIANATLGRGARGAETFEGRLSRGMKAYILRKEGKPAAHLWMTRQNHTVYLLRLLMEVPDDAAIVLDETTSPQNQRLGMLGKLLRFAWDDNSLGMVAMCVRSGNQPSLAANCRLGFRPACTVSLTQLLAMRLHVVRQHEGGAVQWFLSRSRITMNPFMLRCRLDSGGLLDVGWTRIDMFNAPTNLFSQSNGTCPGSETDNLSGSCHE
jgi:hypothetical protein